MEVTKYPQSCLVLSDGDARICIDPGNVALDRHPLDELGDLQAVLYTHRHADHVDERAVDTLLERGVELYANADVCDLLGGRATEVTDGQTLTVAGFEVTARDLPHVPMVDGSPGPPNTGFVIDGALFHPGDAVELPGLQVRALAVPIAGPSISFREAYAFVQAVGAERVIPIHYDYFIADPDHFARVCDLAEVVVLGAGETVTL